MRKVFLLCIVLLTIQPLTVTRSFAQSIGLVSSKLIDKADSVSVLPFLIAENNWNTGAQKILSVSSAEKELLMATTQNNRKAEVKALIGISDSYLAFGQTKKAFSQLRKLLLLKQLAVDDNTVAHLYYNMAVIMARLKNYPMALACFYKAGNLIPKFSFKKKRKRLFAVDSSFLLYEQEPLVTDETEETEPDIFSDSLIDASLMLQDTLHFHDHARDLLPIPENEASVIDPFMDNKQTSAYAVAIHIKQPVAGKKKVFAKLGDVGHMFVTLIKYNDDGSSVVRTFGFYPQKGILFSANPLFPSTAPVLKNDEGRNWDEMIGRFIPEESFHRILDFIDNSMDKNYHLSKFNCSDFALGIAALANIHIDETTGTWPLGKGNNPGCAGQSILSGKFKNIESNSVKGLFACTDNLFASGN